MEEIIATEMSYVRDVMEVTEGYLMPLQMRTNVLPLSNEQINSLFGNIVEIREFHRSVASRVSPCVYAERGQTFYEE